MLLRYLLFVFVFTACCRANLIRNGDFAAGTDRPADWSVVTTDQKVTVERVNDKVALRVDVEKENGKSLGEIRQTVKIKANTKYRLSGEIKSTKARQAMIQLKPRIDGREADRIGTEFGEPDKWTTVTKEFDSGQATEVQVLCRFNQRAESVGTTSWF